MLLHHLKAVSATTGVITAIFGVLATPRRRSRAPLQAINSAQRADVSKTSESGMDYAVSFKSRQSDGRNIWNNRDKVRILCVKVNFNKLF